MLFKRKKKYSMPEGATITTRRGVKIAQWIDGRGKKRQAAVTDDGRIEVEMATYTARYRNAAGVVVEQPTGCRGYGAAQSRLTEWLREVERIRAGVLSLTEAATAEWSHVPLADHIAAFRSHMTAKGLHKDTITTRCAHLTSVVTECKFRCFPDVSRSKVERLLLDKVREGMGARTHNAYVAACSAFGNWAVKQGRIMVNPFVGLVKQNERADRRRIRRALTEEESARLLAAAAERPLHDFLYKPRRDGTDEDIAPAENTNPETLDGLRWLGTVRATAYKTMLQTGLRYGECRSLRICDVHLEADTPYIELRAADEKSRRGAQIALHHDLAATLKNVPSRTHSTPYRPF